MSLWIKDWDKVFHLVEAYKYGQPTWTKFPISRSGLSYRRLMGSAAGRTAYCVFVGCVRIAARGITHGKLVDKERDLTPEDLAAETGISVKDCKRAFELLQTAEIGWFTDKPPGPHRATTGEATGNALARAEQSRAEQNKTNTSSPDSAVRAPVGSEGKGGNSQGELPACLPATVREALQRLKIGEPALTRLADSPGLSVPHVMAAWEEAQEGNPRDPRRVLVHALCRIAGIELPRKRGTVGNALNSDPAFQRLSQTLNARRNRGS